MGQEATIVSSNFTWRSCTLHGAQNSDILPIANAGRGLLGNKLSQQDRRSRSTQWLATRWPREVSLWRGETWKHLPLLSCRSGLEESRAAHCARDLRAAQASTGKKNTPHLSDTPWRFACEHVTARAAKRGKSSNGGMQVTLYLRQRRLGAYVGDNLMERRRHLMERMWKYKGKKRRRREGWGKDSNQSNGGPLLLIPE